MKSASLIALSVFLLIACAGKNSIINEKSESQDNGIIKYAKKLDIKNINGYSQVSIINPWQGANGNIHIWYLIPRGKEVPSSVDSSRVIFVPISRIICMSTTHLAMISSLGEAGTVKGFSGTRFLYDRELLQKAERGEICEIGYEENLNKELIVELEPELIMVYGIGSESSGYIGKLNDLGIKVFYNADYLEEDPLGKAEWIKLFGLLYDKEHEADSIFNTITSEYNSIKARIDANIINRPKVMLGLPFQDTWYISAGNSYISKLIDDAGGDYLWKNTNSQVSMPLGLENVFIKAISADYWLNAGNADNQDQILSIDQRLGELPCFKKGNIFNNNKRITANGGNDYWEGGAVNPQILLTDISSILHPELFPGRELIYYEQLK
jgi:iron complex transport system substrate-binding protein